MPKKNISNYIVPSVDKSLDIITLLDRKPGLSLKEIYTELSLPLSTCFNIITTLENRGFIEKEASSGKYRLGVTLMRLGLNIYETKDIRKIAVPVMEKLVSMFKETSYLSIVDHATKEGIVLEKIESQRTITVVRSVGSKIPLYASATGKSLLSGFTEEELDEYAKKVKFTAFSDNTITSWQDLKKELRLIREQHYATTQNEMGDGVSSVSAPIYNYTNKVVAAVSVAGPEQRMADQIPLIIPEVKKAADHISTFLK